MSTMSAKFKALTLALASVTVLALTVFTVAASNRAAPPAPTLVAPSDGEIVNTHSPLLQWSGSDATVFKVLVKNSAGVKVLKINADPAVACSGSDCSLSPSLNGVDFLNDTFTWKVIAKNVDGKASSVKQTFTVDFPGTPILLSPEDGASAASFSVFSWNVVNAAEQYRVRAKNKTTGEKLTLTDWTNSGDLCSDICVSTYEGSFAQGAYKWWVEARQITFPNVSKSEKWGFTVTPAR